MTASDGTEKKTPERPPAEIVADIEKERTALGASLDALRGELDEAIVAGRERVKEIGRKAAVVAPVAGAVVVSVSTVIFVRRRRSGRKD